MKAGIVVCCQSLTYHQPEDYLGYPSGGRNYASGWTCTADDKVAEADAELAERKKATDDTAIEGVRVWDRKTAKSLVRMAARILEGEIAAKRGQQSRAISLLRKAVALEDKQNYDEPPSWYMSTRHVLGALYLQVGKPKAAERVYREDLAVFPNNGWALFGLAQALDAQGKRSEAATVRAEFEQAWSKADVELTASWFM